MENQIQSQFREDEIVLIQHFDKKKQELISNAYPKIGGRLRLAHDENKNLSIETEIIKYDGKIAVIAAASITNKGKFKGLGMASVERDKKIAPAILELAESRSIARSLRFAGYGVEYCSAEEVSHLENANKQEPQNNNPKPYQKNNSSSRGKSFGNGNNGGNFNNGNGNGQSRTNGKPSQSDYSSDSGNGSNGNGNGRVTARQYNYIMRLCDETGRDKTALDNHCVNIYGTVAQHLSKIDASALINQLLVE